jgi:hypothetical protein
VAVEDEAMDNQPFTSKYLPKIVAVEDGAKDKHHSTSKYSPEKEKAVMNSGVVISFLKQDYLHRDSKTRATSVSMKFDIEKQCVCH